MHHFVGRVKVFVDLPTLDNNLRFPELVGFWWRGVGKGDVAGGARVRVGGGDFADLSERCKLGWRRNVGDWEGLCEFANDGGRGRDNYRLYFLYDYGWFFGSCFFSDFFPEIMSLFVVWAVVVVVFYFFFLEAIFAGEVMCMSVLYERELLYRVEVVGVGGDGGGGDG